MITGTARPFLRIHVVLLLIWLPKATVVLEVEGLHGRRPALEEAINPAGLMQAGIARREEHTVLVQPGGERRAGSSLEEYVGEPMVPCPHVKVHGRKNCQN